MIQMRHHPHIGAYIGITLLFFISLRVTVAQGTNSKDAIAFLKIPQPQTTQVHPGSPGSVDALISWKSYENEAINAENKLSGGGNGGNDVVEAYELQRSIAGSGKWITVSDSLTGTLYPNQTDIHEKQTVYTRADNGQVISDGYFRLTLSYAGKSAMDVHNRAVTPPIPFDASEAQMKAALQKIETILNVQVFREGPDALGGYKWVVLFDPPEKPRVTEGHGNVPLLILYSETISASYSGPGDQVAIQENREGSIERVMCVKTCQAYVTGLSPSTEYSFRLRARYSQLGWSVWSPASDAFMTPNTDLPLTPSRPGLVSATSDRITLKWLSVPESLGQNQVAFPMQFFQIEQKCEDDIEWLTVQNRLAPGPVWSIGSSGILFPNTSCIFRTRAINENGAGPFSIESPPFRTLARVPSTPQAVNLEEDFTVLTWESPKDLGGSDIVSYDIQYRELTSSTWIQVLPSKIDLSTKKLVLDLSFKPYTRYLFRVRAKNSMGVSEWAQSNYVLSPFRIEESTERPASTAVSITTLKSVLIKGAKGDEASNKNDVHYVNGIAFGGSNQNDGGDGLVVIQPVTLSGERSPRLYFFSGFIEKYTISSFNADPIVYLDVLAWGGGGGSGGKSQLGKGGGGAFARASFPITHGDVIEVIVGGGGKGYTNGGAGGYNGGGDGGRGHFAGGGGGGASEVRINSKTVVIAAGGGGGGSTDYCCAHGGGGGAEIGEDGLFPDAVSIPTDNRISGIIRNEYHSAYVEGDTRDFVGLPATHQHLDYGFSPEANFTTLATGGRGGSLSYPGKAGQKSSYEFSRYGKSYVKRVSDVANIVSVLSLWSNFAPTDGRRNVGGNGQDGKDGGGGGGAGFYGGGGGGSGVDGAGGGGGSSFVSVSDVRVLEKDPRIPPREGVQAFDLKVLSSRSVSLSWTAPQYGFRQEILGFVIEMANGSASEDFQIMAMPDPDQYNYTQYSLSAGTWYRFRVKLLTRENTGIYSIVRPVKLPLDPTNTCHLINQRMFSERDSRAGLRYADSPSSSVRILPSARRGHSLSVINDFIFLYGGYSRGYPCIRGHKMPCTDDAGVNSELWRFDPVTNIWLEVKPINGILPPPREKHSAALLSNRLLIFGGRNNDELDATASLSDLWEMNPTAQISGSLSDLQTNLVIKEGKELFTIGNAGASKDYCISDMTVQVTITHTCLQNLKIQVFGPGPSTFPSRQQDKDALVTPDGEVTWSNDQGFGTGGKRMNPSVPSSRSFPVTLFEIPFPSDTPCISGQRTLKFSPSAAQSLSSVFTPTDGEVQPLDPLSVFYGLPANGGWTLMVSDGSTGGKSGTLNSWDIKFKLERCVPTYTWKDLSKSVTGTPPSARYQHSAIVYQNSMYIFGGKNDVQLEDLYRFDYVPDSSTSKWVKLSAFPYDKRHFGHSFVLTPYHLLSVGGGVQGREFRDRLSRVEIRQKTVHTPKQGWRKLPLDGVENTEAKMLSFEGIPLKSHLMNHQRQGFGKLPSARYFASAAFFQPSTAESRSPQFFLFGGQDETTYFEDLWRIDLTLLSQENPDSDIVELRKRVCNWRLSNIAFQTMWLNSCGATPAIASSGALTMCKLDTILLYSWCEKTYQTIQNL